MAKQVFKGGSLAYIQNIVLLWRLNYPTSVPTYSYTQPLERSKTNQVFFSFLIFNSDQMLVP